MLDNKHERTRRWIKKHQDGREFQIAELSFYRSSKGRSKGLPNRPDNKWLEEIFSQDPEDLHQLVSSGKLAKAIQALTVHQRNIMFLSAIQQMKTKEYPDVVDVGAMRVMLGGIGKRTAYRLLRDGVIECVRMGRVYKVPKISIISYLCKAEVESE